MFCPVCESEFREGITECPDCEVPLVEALPPPPEDEPLTEVFRTGDASLLPVVKSVLAAAGMPHIVQGEEASGLFPFGPGAGADSDGRLLAAVVLVPEDRAEEARALLASHEEE